MRRFDLRDLPRTDWASEADREGFTESVREIAAAVDVDLTNPAIVRAVALGSTLNNFLIARHDFDHRNSLTGSQMMNWCGVATGAVLDILDTLEGPS